MELNAQSICNYVRSEAEGISKHNLPIKVFPQKVQKIILDLAAYENYHVEYTIAALLSAIATAIGNTHSIRIRGSWTCSPALYMILIGRAGLGKTPPIAFAYRPIRKYDELCFRKYKKQMEIYESQNFGKGEKGPAGSSSKPVLKKTVVTDFTTEAMINIHKDNLRGIAVVVDELLALIKSINRYGSGNPLVEYLLSSYSGQPIDSVRKTEKVPIHISKPCINVIGSIQTLLLENIFNQEYTANGLLDRFLFVFPRNNMISHWSLTLEDTSSSNIIECWSSIIDKLLNLPLEVNPNDESIVPKVLDLSKEARECFYSWNNEIIDNVNSISDDNQIESRIMKLNGNLARLSLILQLLKWACGEGDKDLIDLDSVKGGITLVEYFEDCYQRAKKSIVLNEIAEVKDAWLSLLPDVFTTAEAIKMALKLGISRRTVFNSLTRLASLENAPIIKDSHGKYRKVKEETPNALCTFALSPSENKEASIVDSYEKALPIVQSASANDIVGAKNDSSHEF